MPVTWSAHSDLHDKKSQVKGALKLIKFSLPSNRVFILILLLSLRSVVAVVDGSYFYPSCVLFLKDVVFS